VYEYNLKFERKSLYKMTETQGLVVHAKPKEVK